MERKPIKSSNLVSVGYDKNTKCLEVEFHSGQVFQYTPISRKTYLDLMTSPSVGSYFAQNIRNNSKYKTEKV